MSRTRADALVLVNWNGVFYERYLLHRHVTALEGANGAGKTTVMIAAYVVLLPDMSRLRFTNLGETGATGGDKGIWGRLGEPGRPSYAAIDFALPKGGRLIAGVHLERKGEPSVEPTPFVVTGLAADVRLQDLMLVRHGDDDAVPELPELRENAARVGGRLQSFPSAREYFLALFDHGVTPLRLGTEEEKTKLNEMLRTSMTGGISRALTSELRAFLLKEESGLASTLAQMKANLDACRRTRTEVQEARRLEQEIGGVLQAGQAMFEAVVSATRERAMDLRRRVAESEATRAKAQDAVVAADLSLQEIETELVAATERRESTERRLADAKVAAAQLNDALEAWREVLRLREVLAAAEGQERSAAEHRTEAEAVLVRKRAELRRCEDHHRRAAEGLADMQRGIEELHRRAGAYLQTSRRLREAQERLGVDRLDRSELEPRRTSCAAELSRVDAERREASVLLADADEHRRRYAEVLEALRGIEGKDVEGTVAHAVATAALSADRARRVLVERLPAIARDLKDARGLKARQRSALARAEALGVAASSGSTDGEGTLGEGEAGASRVSEVLAIVEAERARAVEAERQAQAELAGVERARVAHESRRVELDALRPRWHALEGSAARLGEHLGAAIVDRAGLDRARRSIADEHAAVVDRERAVAAAHEQRIAEARRLLATGGSLPPDLLRLKDDLGAELLAASFEDAKLGEAARLEARLGPLVHALVVEDPRAAAHDAGARADALPEVWIVPREADLQAIVGGSTATEQGTRDLVIEEGVALRVSRIPEHPRLGRRAREQRAESLRAEAEALSTELTEIRAHRRVLERLADDGDALLADQAVWLAGDPGLEQVEVEQAIARSIAQADRLRATTKRAAMAAQGMSPRIDGLKALLGEAYLLDPPDHGARAKALQAEHDAATAARSEVARTAGMVAQLEAGLDALRRPPLSDTETGALRERVASLRADRDRLDAAIDAIGYVIDHVEALAWSDAPRRLAGEEALVPALKEQLAAATKAREDAQGREAEAAARALDLTSAWQDADGRRRATAQEVEAAQARFSKLGIEDPTQEALDAAQAEVVQLSAESTTLATTRDELLGERGQRQSARGAAAQTLQEAEDKLEGDRREAEPAIARWQRLQDAITQHDLLGGATAQDIGPAGIRGHVNLVQEAGERRVVLVERLRGAQGGPALLARLQILGDESDADFADEHLALWLAVRDWLRRRLPAQVAEVDDPREALLRLRDRLATLEERLAGQEDDLRGASEDVARGIDVQIRKARGQVTRLNRNLDGVSFGSIEGIRVRLQPVERMEQVLRALKEGAAQALLFSEDMPIEQALDEIFKRYGGGRTGGQRLLDYREYVHLQVEIRRKAGGADWEIANPTRLSTGEAIGVGAALMMVVLTEWERDATLLRGRKAHGSLRFLFLDEANRLSHDNLGVLFDLCRTLDLQLLIAAPEVARAEGNTTYRLVRRTTQDGREEVLVSGRRTLERV